MARACEPLSRKNRSGGEGILIFVVTGSGRYPFHRLLKTMDDVAFQMKLDVVLQTGYTDFTPLYCRHFGFLPYRKFLLYYREADLIVSHASGGPLVYSRFYSKPIILVPRRPELGEIFNRHQIETAEAVAALNDNRIHVAFDDGLIQETVRQLLSPARPPENGNNELERLRRALKEELSFCEKA